MAVTAALSDITEPVTVWHVLAESGDGAVYHTVVPLSLGFSRQEYWRGLPFPSPMHEGEK